MITVFDMYKVLQPLHKALYAMRDEIPDFSQISTSNLVVSIFHHGISIAPVTWNQQIIFECLITTGVSTISRQAIQPDLCRIKSDLNGHLSDEQFCCNLFTTNEPIMMDMAPSEDQHFQASLMGDIMNLCDMISLIELVGDIASDKQVLKALNNYVMSYEKDTDNIEARLVLNYYPRSNLSDIDLGHIIDEVMGEVVPVLNQFISEVQGGSCE